MSATATTDLAMTTTKALVEDLRPCPFCGGEAEIVEFYGGENDGGSCVSCTRCQASSNVEFEFRENFVSNWNRRAIPAPPEGMRERIARIAWLASDWDSPVMKAWDKARRYLLEGCTGSLPRDTLEAALDEIIELAKEVEALLPSAPPTDGGERPSAPAAREADNG